jgi:hypothetical protein
MERKGSDHKCNAANGFDTGERRLTRRREIADHRRGPPMSA